jgi:hypothetical protein
MNSVYSPDPSKCNILGKNAMHCAILSDCQDTLIVDMLKHLLRENRQWYVSL